MCRPYVLVCSDTGCTSSGGPGTMKALQNRIKKQGLGEEVAVVETGYHDLCALGPAMIAYPDATFHSMVQSEDIPEIAAEHLLRGRVVAHFLYQKTISPSDSIKALSDTDFYKKQHRIALRNCGVISPENIGEYIGTGGYQTPGKVLTEMTLDDMIQILLDAGLRDRSGVDFLTGLKWRLCKQNGAGQKYACCNADKGDPDAFMDCSVLEGDPHVLLEATATAGYAIESSQSYVYIRTKCPITVERLKTVINRVHKMELLGKNIFGTGFDFGVDIYLGTGAFVCGEEIALMTPIEGEHGEPGLRPPFPAQKGLFGKPSILNSVGTYANIPQIILNGPEWFAFMGTEKSKDTKIFALGGKANNIGLVEIPMGTTLCTAIDEIGGDIPNGKKFKAIQTGGPSGGCIPAERFDIPINYDNLLSIGSMIGSDGLIIMDKDDCMVDIAKFFLELTVKESYGKCAACHIGAKRMLEILEKITKGTAEMVDLDKLEELCHYIKANSLYGLGQTAPDPVLPTLHFFRDECETHIKEKRYPVGVCRALLSYVIDRDECRGCTLCTRTCPAGVVVGSVKNPHVIDLNKCIRYGARMEKCKFGTIYRR